MDINELMATIFAGIFMLGALGVGFWWLIKYGIQEAKEQRELRRLAIKWLKKHVKEDE